MPGADLASQVADCRPNATATHGNGVTLQASQPATTIAQTSPAAPPSRTVPDAGRSMGTRTTDAAAAASAISTRSAAAVPIAGTSSRLNTSAPAMAPIVLAA